MVKYPGRTGERVKRDCVIGIDLGATNIKAGLLKRNKIIAKIVLPTQDFPSRQLLLSALCGCIGQLLSVANISKEYIRGVGVGLPGPVDSINGVIHFFPNIEGWRNVPLRKLVQDSSGLRVVIDNDANLMALAEARLGAAFGKKNIIGITLGTGVGAGILVDGRLYRGSGLAAGEIGHIPLNEKGPKCNCAGIACLERYVGNKYILEDARKAFGRNITLEELSRLANKGNVRARRIWLGVAEHIGIAVTGIVNFFNPDTIVIGGGVANAGRIIFDRIRKVVRQRAMPIQARAVRIVKARLGNDAGMIGAALLVKEEHDRKS